MVINNKADFSQPGSIFGKIGSSGKGLARAFEMDDKKCPAILCGGAPGHTVAGLVNSDVFR